jgi:hypothetical protein
MLKSMRSQKLLVPLLVSLTVASSLLIAVLPAAARTYTPGVSAGNYVKYGSLSGSYNSTDPSKQTKPQSFKDFENTAFLRVDILSVSGNNVTFKATESFNNGTADKVVTQVQDVNTGVRNSSLASSLFIIAGGLGANDKVCGGTASYCSTLTINSTQTRTYSGASRDTNVWSWSGSGQYGSFSYSYYWDKTTGILVENSISSTIPSGSSQQYSTTQTFHFTATETNIWSATILGLSPIVLYGIIGAIVAIVVIVAAVLVMRMRKPKAPAMPAATGTITPPSEP